LALVYSHAFVCGLNWALAVTEYHNVDRRWHCVSHICCQKGEPDRS